MRPNIHAAGHIYDFLLLFGLVMSWWAFPFEYLIGVLQQVNMNDYIGGMFFFSLQVQPEVLLILGVMEATIIKTITCTANIHCWLH